MNEKVFLKFLQKRIVEITSELNSYFEDLSLPASQWYESYDISQKELVVAPEEYFRKLVYDVISLSSVSFEERVENFYKRLRGDLAPIFGSLHTLSQEKSPTHRQNYFRVGLLQEIASFRNYIESSEFRTEICVYLEYLLKLNGVSSHS